MASNELHHELKPTLTTKLNPLPLILPSLNLLTVPAYALEEELKQRVGDNVFLGVAPPPSAVPLSAFDGDDVNPLENIPAPTSMDEDISSQLRFIPSLEGMPDEVIDTLVQGLDSRGYISEDTLDVLCKFAGLSKKKTLDILKDIQDSIDPPGLFARNLWECLLIQLRRKGMVGKDPWVVLTKGKEFILKKDIRGLSKFLGWTHERTQKALEEIKKLDPYPGNFIIKNQYIVPEIEFVKEKDTIRVRLLHENLPKLFLDAELLEHISNQTLREQWLSAKHTLVALSIRIRTKLRISQFLAKAQKAFLAGESIAPSPLTLKTASRETNYHPSTILRITKTTWALSPVGTIPLEKLLSRPLRAKPTMSVAQLRQAIKEAKPLGISDEALALKLGLPRRTITWHRNKMGM